MKGQQAKKEDKEGMSNPPKKRKFKKKNRKRDKIPGQKNTRNQLSNTYGVCPISDQHPIGKALKTFTPISQKREYSLLLFCTPDKLVPSNP